LTEGIFFEDKEQFQIYAMALVELGLIAHRIDKTSKEEEFAITNLGIDVYNMLDRLIPTKEDEFDTLVKERGL